MLIEQINDVRSEPLERSFDNLLDVLRLAIQSSQIRSRVGIKIVPELGGDHDPVAYRFQRFADEFFVFEWTVDFGSVKECDAVFDRRAYKRDHLLRVWYRSKGAAHSHTAESEGRDF